MLAMVTGMQGLSVYTAERKHNRNGKKHGYEYRRKEKIKATKKERTGKIKIVCYLRP